MGNSETEQRNDLFSYTTLVSMLAELDQLPDSPDVIAQKSEINRQIGRYKYKVVVAVLDKAPKISSYRVSKIDARADEEFLKSYCEVTYREGSWSVEIIEIC